MKKTISNIRTLAALLMAGAAFAACSSDDDIINEQPVNPVKQGYTLTVSASKDGSTTRALSLDGGAVVASWETTDEIVVTKNGTQIGTLSPTNIEGLNATFTGTISGDADINVSDVLTLIYHPIPGGLNGFALQNGTLNGSATSAENFDAAAATVTISEISGKNIIVSESSADFVNQTAVVVLSPYNSSWSEYHSLNSLTVSVTMDIPEVGTVTEKIGPITVTGDQPHYFSLPSQSLLAEVLAAKYSLSASAISTLLASATVTFTGHQTGDSWDREYLTCSKTGYKFAAGKYYKLDNSNFSMTMLYKRAAADKDVYVSSSNTAWSNTVTFAVNKEIGWKVVGDNVYCGDKQLYVEYDEGLDHIARWVKASDGHIPFGATYTLEDPAPECTYTAPTLVGSTLTYNTSAQALVTGGSATNATIYYSTDGGSSWSTDVPTGTNAGNYTVYYKVEPNDGYTGGVESTSLGTKTINKANGWVSLSSTSSSGWLGRFSKSVNVTVNHHGGSLSASKSGGTGSQNLSVSFSGNTMTLSRGSGTGSGLWDVTVTVYSAATQNYNAASATYICYE